MKESGVHIGTKSSKYLIYFYILQGTLHWTLQLVYGYKMFVRVKKKVSQPTHYLFPACA